MRMATSGTRSKGDAHHRVLRVLRRNLATTALKAKARTRARPTSNPRTLRRHYAGLARVLSEVLARGTPSKRDLEEEVEEKEAKDDRLEEESGESEGELPALTVKAERATTRSLWRLARHWRPEPGGDALRTSVLEGHSTPSVVRLHYLALLDGFLGMRERDGKELKTPEEVDECMVKALTEMYFEGHDIGIGTKLVAGWMACFPRFSRAGDLKMPRSWRALEGWRWLAPPRSGAVLFVVAGIAALLARNVHIDVALWTLLGFGGYLRPSTNMRLRRGSLIPPVPSLTEYWAVLLNPPEFFERSKMGVADESVMWDVPELLWMKRAARLRAAATRRQDAEGAEFQLPGGRQADRCSRCAAGARVHAVPAPALQPELGPAEGEANAEGDPEAWTLGKLLQCDTLRTRSSRRGRVREARPRLAHLPGEDHREPRAARVRQPRGPRAAVPCPFPLGACEQGFQKARPHWKGKEPLLVLDIFSGKGGVASCVRRRRDACIRTSFFMVLTVMSLTPEPE